MYKVFSCKIKEAGPVYKAIYKKITASLKPCMINIHDDSLKHGKHLENPNCVPRPESHFRLFIVSDEFEGMSIMDRHKHVFNLLDEELKLGPLHALTLSLKTSKEYEKFPKPFCNLKNIII